MHDKNKKEVVVTKDDVKESWIDLEKSFTEFGQLVEKIYKYSTWATNVSIAILGFVIAILLQLKSEKAIFDVYVIMLIFITLGLTIAIGFYLKIRYEISVNWDSLKRIWKNLIGFFKEVINKFEEKGVDISDASKLLDKISDLKFKESKFDSPFKNIPIRLIYIQIFLVLISLILTAYYVVKYIFFL